MRAGPLTLAVFATVTVALPIGHAHAQRCVRIAGGLLYQSPGCQPPTERGGDRGESLFWQERHDGRKRDPAADFPLVMPPDRRFPGPIPAPRAGTREGPITLDDLRLAPDGRGGYRGQRPGFRFAIDPDGTVHFQDRPSIGLSAFLLMGLVGFFDVTDLVMRLHGDDPYAYDKALVLSLTRPMREKLTDQDRQRRIDRALRALPRSLAALWARTDLPPSQRRELLFQLWDEMLEDDGIEAAAIGRREILDFIRRQLPAGTPEAYAADELERLNRGRRSRAEFAPYP